MFWLILDIVSNLSFLYTNNVFKLFQSGFKKYHSTENALLKVLKYVLISADSGDCTVLVLLDLSVAFDTVYGYTTYSLGALCWYQRSCP